MTYCLHKPYYHSSQWKDMDNKSQINAFSHLDFKAFIWSGKPEWLHVLQYLWKHLKITCCSVRYLISTRLFHKYKFPTYVIIRKRVTIPFLEIWNHQLPWHVEAYMVQIYRHMVIVFLRCFGFLIVLFIVATSSWREEKKLCKNIIWIKYLLLKKALGVVTFSDLQSAVIVKNWCFSHAPLSSSNAFL